MKKVLKISGIVLIAIVILAMLVVLGFKAYDRIRYDSFYDVAEKEFYIPGLAEGFVPQGFEYMEQEKVFLACGYMTNEKCSRVYVIDKDGDEYYYTELKDINADNYTGHTGGIAYYRDCLYITGSDGIDVFDLNEVMDPSIKHAYLKGTINTYGVDPAFCYIYDGELITGSFHRDGDYDTPQKHHYKTSSGEINKGVMLAFNLTDVATAKYYVDPTPVAAYSIPSFVQGVCVTDGGKLVLSTSWGLSTSNLYIHDLEKVKSRTNSDFSKTAFDLDIPLYSVDSETLVDTIEAPPMAEEIVYLDGKIWIFNESACNKYIFGKLTTGNYLFSYEYPAKKK
ncbi:MAG: hypothetical protein E7596_01825 [Ruminococcaceae bacterium]|nr:hypothetical protein [Oscillospiraceae bacterium]